MDQKKKFRKDFKEWVKIDQEMKKLSLKLKYLRKRKEQLTPNIVNYMDKMNYNNITINKDYEMNLKKSNVFESLNKKYITKQISEYLNSSFHGGKITEILYNNRKKKVKKNLSISKQKKENLIKKIKIK